MNTIQIFSNPQFGQIRVKEVNGEPYFVGIDVATALGYGLYKSVSSANKGFLFEFLIFLT